MVRRINRGAGRVVDKRGTPGDFDEATLIINRLAAGGAEESSKERESEREREGEEKSRGEGVMSVEVTR